MASIKRSSVSILIACALIGVLGIVSVFCSRSFSSGGEAAATPVASKKVAYLRDAYKGGPAAKAVRIRPQETSIPQVEKEKPLLLLTAQEEAELTELQKKIISDIQEALDEEDLATLTEVVSRLQEQIARAEANVRPGAGRAELAAHIAACVPKSIRMKAIEALGWFGAEALPELVGYMADPDPEVVQYTYAQFEQAIMDITLSDRDRADIVVMASRVLSDQVTLDNMMMQIFDMRHSVALGTILEVAEVGTPEASGKMTEVMELYTGEKGIKTEKQAAAWLEENPDGEFDEDFYGGWKME